MVKDALGTLVAAGSFSSGDTVIITHGDAMETIGCNQYNENCNCCLIILLNLKREHNGSRFF